MAPPKRPAAKTFSLRTLTARDSTNGPFLSMQQTKDITIPVLIFLIFIGGLVYFISKGVKNNEKPMLQNLTNTTEIVEGGSVGQKAYKVVLATSQGNITIQLNKTETPNTVANFVTLAKKDFYKNTIFHRVVKGFMIQGGDPEGTGTGGPGYTFADEPFTGEYAEGTVAMANAGPNTNGSQFFIMHRSKPLAKAYTIFGKVIEGMDVVDKIANAPVEVSLSGENSKPISPTVITDVTVIEE